MLDEIKELNEECGVFGIYNSDKANELTYFGLHSLQHRGQEGAGIVTTEKNNNIYGHHGLGLLVDVFKNKKNLEKLKGTSAIGHVRYATSGNGSIENIQPFLFNFDDEKMALAHNGNLTNAKTLRNELEQNGAIFRSSSDTEVLMHLIRNSKENDFKGKLIDSLLQIKGGFAFVLLKGTTLIAIRDANGFRPLSLGKRLDGSIIVASETCALDAVKAEFIRDVEPGEVVIINDKGINSFYFTENRSLSIAAMEYIYFARPDSVMNGVNVHSSRKKMGKTLAKEHPVNDADMVIGVPNSSLSAANGYAEESGLPLEMGLVKNQYVGRTFIQPTQELREQGVNQKLAVVKSIIEGKKVVLVDDSIVRGTTSKNIVQKLKDAGAKEIHLRIASPPLKYPDFYGIDIKSQDELLAANYPLNEMNNIIGSDSLEFLSEEGLITSIGIKTSANYGGLCMANFNGDYPTPICDYEKDYLKNLR